MWLELVPITHIDAMRNLAAARQFSSGEKHGGALQLHWFTFYSGIWSPPPFLWTWCHGWVGGATKSFFSDLRRTLHFAAGGAKGTTLEPHSGVARAHGVVETCSLLPQALCRQSFVAVGAAFWCWLGTWLYVQHSSAAVGLVLMTPEDVA